MRSTIFISYSRKDQSYCDELLPALRAVADVRQYIWRDREEIGVGDHFHPKIQEALADTRLAIVLLSKHVLTSDYVMQHELPMLLSKKASGALKLGFLYVSAVSEAALKIDFDSGDGRQCVDLSAIHSFNTWQRTLRDIRIGQRDHVYASVADWVFREAGAARPSTPPAGTTRYDLAIFITDRKDHWQHQFFPGAYAEAIKPRIDCLPPAQTFG
ncbi:MAG TPA: toll/interleukin-1 receptor domain-containing protein, partial [Accumulibacter sp.]|nr:toll/interleukin-1 receptor domain-containing protein [Accumulibacter sp.]